MSEIEGFHDVLFPTDISLQSSGTIERETQIVTLGSGREQRNQRRARSRRRYEVGYGVKTLEALQLLVAFYEARRGPLNGFRFRDPADNASGPANQPPAANDQFLGTGDGATATFPLTKTYGDTATGYLRSITRPVAGSVRVAVDGVEQTEGTDFTVGSGTITFASPAIPQAGDDVTAGFVFDVLVRFMEDQLSVNLPAFSAGEAPAVSLLEVVE